MRNESSGPITLLKTGWNFLRLTRPLFLLGGVLLYWMGTLAAATMGIHLDLWKYMTGQIMVTSIQLMTHYSNEYFDLEGDRLNNSRTWFSGGSGVLATGEIPPQTALYAAITFALLSCGALVISSFMVPAVSILGLLGLVTAWSYSGPPLALERTGWGELTASVLVAVFVPLVGYTMQSGVNINLVILVAGTPLILIHLAMLIAFQIPDRFADAESGKRTLVVRLGLPAGIRLHNIALLVAACLILALSIDRWPGAQYIWLGLPIAVWQIFHINRFVNTANDLSQYRQLTLGAVALFVTTLGLWVVGFMILWGKIR